MKKKILFIPHTTVKVRTRTMEFAKQFTDDFEVYLLVKSERDSGSSGLSLSNIFYVLREAFRPSQIQESDSITYINIPKISLPINYLAKYNEHQLHLITKKLGIDILVNASAYLYPVRKGNLIYIYDLVDDHADYISRQKSMLAPIMASQVQKFIDVETMKSDYVLTCSRTLQEMVNSRHPGKNAIFVPNGADVSEYQNVPKKNIESLKKSLGLESKYIIGCIGNHRGNYTGISFLVDFFNRLSELQSDVVLLIVGPYNEQDVKLANDNIRFVGAKPVELMPTYFNMIDLGVLPFDITPFTDGAFPMKIIEYSAARKPVISTPLKEVRRLNLPNVLFAKQDVGQWIEQFNSLVTFSWDEKWDRLICPYEWKALAEKIKNLL